MNYIEQGKSDLFSKPVGYYECRREDMLKYIPANVERTLELGCALGNFSELVKARLSAECWGVEINEQAAKVAEKKLDKVINADINECFGEIPDRYFDCIICNDFLEHLADPYSLLVHLKGKFADGGVLVASFPNVRHWHNLFELLVRGDWDYKNSGVLDKTHLRFFTYKSLQKMFPKLGYELLTIEPLAPNITITSTAIKILNMLLLNRFVDTRYLQFACVARPVM